MLSLLLAVALAAEPSPPRPPEAARPAAAPSLPTLRVGDLVEGGTSPGPSARARELAGRRVRLLGYMARLEEPVAGSFWLAAGPVECDEGGAGTGDLPPGTVLVLTGERGRAADEHVAGPIAVTGLLHVGQEATPDGQVSAFRLLLDPEPAGALPLPTPQPATTTQGASHARHP